MSKYKNARQRSGPDAPGNTLRIIGGKWRGQKLHFPSQPGLRPTGDRIRETLFNWLAADLPGAHCLDLFSGSGALGIEAVSRGASSATLIEQSSSACNALRSHCDRLNAEQTINIVNTDAIEWFRRQLCTHYDIIFLDPPFASDLLGRILVLLNDSPLLRPGTLIYIESARDQPIAPVTSWQRLRHKVSGQVTYQLMEKLV